MTTLTTQSDRTAPGSVVTPDARGSCGICGGVTRRLPEPVVGYREDLVYAVVACDGCGVRHVDPMVEEAGLYEQIYQVAGDLPGYWRYERYAEAVRRHRSPLRYLAGSEDVYWGVARALEEIDVRDRRARVLEIGSGLGYLTHALDRADHDVEGFELSDAAVAKARERFGSTRFSSPTDGDRLRDGAPWDVIVACELIEHVADAAGLLRQWSAALAPGGRIVLTTPNRDYWPAAAPWATDLPPVHLWWFSEQSVLDLAGNAGFDARLVDFTDFNRTNWSARSRPRGPSPSPLDAAGRVRLDGPRWVTRLARRPWARRVAGVLIGRHLRGGQPPWRSATLCAVLTRSTAQ